MESLGSRNLTAKTPFVEDAYGRLIISEGSIPTIGRNSKEDDGYERRRMGDS
jgi:hypothetical protein